MLGCDNKSVEAGMEVDELDRRIVSVVQVDVEGFELGSVIEKADISNTELPSPKCLFSKSSKGSNEDQYQLHHQKLRTQPNYLKGPIKLYPKLLINLLQL